MSASIEVRGDRAVLRSPFNQEALTTIRQVPGLRWSGTHRVWHGPVTCLEELITAAGQHWPLHLDNTVHQERARIVRARKSARSAVCDESLSLPGGQLYPYQAAGVRFLRDRHGVGLIADEMGLGKTVQALALAHSIDGPVLVICPASLRLNWAAEIEKWLHTPPRDIVIGGIKQKKRNPLPWTCVSQPDTLPAGAPFYVVNYDILSRWKNRLRLAAPWGLVVFDESHFLKNSRSQRSRAAQEIRDCSRRVVLLSGTPAANGIQDLWHQLHLLDPQLWSGKERGYKGFTAKYAGGFEGKWGWQLRPDRAKAGDLEDLGENIVGTFIARRTKTQVLPDLPKKTRCTVQLDTASMTTTNYMAQVSALEALREQLKGAAGNDERIQTIQGEILGGMATLRQRLGVMKVEAAVHWCNETLETKPFVIFAWHREVQTELYERLQREDDRKVGAIFGSHSAQERAATVAAFQAGELDVLVCSILAAGVGLTLTRASHVVFLERSYRPADLDQAEDRIHRIGQEQPCWAWYLDAPSTFDATLAKAVDAKRDAHSLVLDGEVLRMDGSPQAQLQLFQLYMNARQ
ncbi:hypothetical protein CMI47_02785 [Candidatus Pacearchaeota archaeon]|nr:hypothetical protein [Candidatus Pacearchaeota archaeon]|tara:strand:+ start:3133 stop:4860 length:1728 start_codon:yes stop_codon:yes gene_type:complete